MATPAESPSGRRARRPLWAIALSQNTGLALAALMLAVSLAVYVAIYAAAQHALPGNFELTSAVDTTMPLACAAVAQTLVVLTSGIDLSVGGVVDLANGLAAITLGHSVASMVLGSLVVLATGACCGLVNGLLVAYGRLQPILVTLATLSIFQGVAIRILPQPGGQVPGIYTNLLASTAAPWSLLYVLAIAGFWWMFRRNPLGVAILAVGNDPLAAASNGVATRQARVLAYVLGGTFSAAGGLFLAASATAGDATAGNAYTLTSIVAAVLGGVSLSGGSGSAVGAMIGAFISTVIVDILFFAHIDPLYQSFYEGLFLLVAVVLVGTIGGALRRRI